MTAHRIKIAALDFCDERGVPDLQKLVAIFGPYDKITPEAWVQWDQANADYQEQRRVSE